jgi:hypothetical protein
MITAISARSASFWGSVRIRLQFCWLRMLGKIRVSELKFDGMTLRCVTFPAALVRTEEEPADEEIWADFDPEFEVCPN